MRTAVFALACVAGAAAFAPAAMPLRGVSAPHPVSHCAAGLSTVRRRGVPRRSFVGMMERVFC